MRRLSKTLILSLAATVGWAALAGAGATRAQEGLPEQSWSDRRPGPSAAPPRDEAPPLPPAARPSLQDERADRAWNAPLHDDPTRSAERDGAAPRRLARDEEVAYGRPPEPRRDLAWSDSARPASDQAIDAGYIPPPPPSPHRIVRGAYPAPFTFAHASCQPCAATAERRNRIAQALHDLQVRRVDLAYERATADAQYRHWVDYDGAVSRTPLTETNRGWLTRALDDIRAGERTSGATRRELDEAVRALDAEQASLTERLQAEDIALESCGSTICRAPDPRGEVSEAAPRGGPAGDALDRAVLAELNAARADPAGYAAKLRRWRVFYHDRLLQTPGDETGVMTREGVAAVDEAIADLERMAPLPPLDSSPLLIRSAARHVADQGPEGLVGHVGSDGSTVGQRLRDAGMWAGLAAENISFGHSTAEAVVRQLIIDDGVPDRGHRANIFDAKLNLAGVGCGPHQRYGWMCVIDFAGAVASRTATPDPAARRDTVAADDLTP